MVSPAGRRQDIQGQQVTATDQDAPVSINNIKIALIVRSTLSNILARANTSMPVTAKQAPSESVQKAEHVASELWNGSPPPSDLPPELPSIEEKSITIECDEIAKPLADEFNLELNAVGKFRVEVLKNQGYTFNKELGICISEDFETIFDLDQLNKMENPIETHRYSSAFHPSKTDVKNTGVDIKDPIDVQDKGYDSWSSSSLDEENTL